MMIDPSEDEPSTRLRYEKYIARSLDERGQIMIDTIEINSRKELENTRIGYFKQFEDLFSATVDCISMSKERLLTDQEIRFIKIFLNRVFGESEHGHPFCSMIKHNFYERAVMIKEILLQKGYLI